MNWQKFITAILFVIGLVVATISLFIIAFNIFITRDRDSVMLSIMSLILSFIALSGLSKIKEKIETEGDNNGRDGY